MLEDVVRKGRLLDIYGPLLTERQHQCMELYFLMDWSLAEIGEELHISRQGAYDMLSRASRSLEGYEEKLHLLARHDQIRSHLDDMSRLLDRGGPENVAKVKSLLQNLDI